MRECERDERVVGITAAMNSGTGLNILQKAMPERYFDVGIAEQQAVLFAAGLALRASSRWRRSTRPSCSAPTTRSSTTSACRSSTSSSRWTAPGLVGDDGPTHHGAFDIAYLRCLPNIVLMAPRDEAMLVHMLHTALDHDDGPIALRYPRGEGARRAAAATGRRRSRSAPARSCARPHGRGRAGRRVALIGYGTGVGKALEAADAARASTGSPSTVADARFAKPIDAGLSRSSPPSTTCS